MKRACFSTLPCPCCLSLSRAYSCGVGGLIGVGLAGVCGVAIVPLWCRAASWRACRDAFSCILNGGVGTGRSPSVICLAPSVICLACSRASCAGVGVGGVYVGGFWVGGACRWGTADGRLWGVSAGVWVGRACCVARFCCFSARRSSLIFRLALSCFRFSSASSALFFCLSTSLTCPKYVARCVSSFLFFKPAITCSLTRSVVVRCLSMLIFGVGLTRSIAVMSCVAVAAPYFLMYFSSRVVVLCSDLSCVVVVMSVGFVGCGVAPARVSIWLCLVSSVCWERASWVWSCLWRVICGVDSRFFIKVSASNRNFCL